MKTKINQPSNKVANEAIGVQTPSLARAKEISREEGIDYTDDELTEVLQFVSKVVSITTTHYERTKQNKATVININTNTTHETASLPIYPRQHRRAS